MQKEEKMIIYYAMTKFHLIFSITHKLSEHNQEEAILFLYSGLQDIEMNYNRLYELGIFKDVYIVPEIELRKGWKGLNDNSSHAEIESNVRLLIDKVEEWLPVKFGWEDTIYIANDHCALGSYCIYKKIPYIYYEDGVGMLSKPEYSYQLVRKLNVTHSIVASYLGAFGQNENVVKKLADLNNQSEGFSDEKAEHYCLKDKLEQLSAEDKNNLLYVFDAPKCQVDRKSTILLTEHFVNMKRLSIEGQREIYAMLVDFFGVGKLFIKPHPNDFQISYPEIFNDAQMISRKFPSELLPYCFNGNLELGLAACSTSVYGLKNILNRALRFDIDIENHYKKLFQYYVLQEIIKECNENDFDKIFTVNTYNDILDAFNIQYFTDLSAKKNAAVFVFDDKEPMAEFVTENADGESKTFIFMNTEIMIEQIGTRSLNTLVAVKLKIEPFKDKSFTEPKEEYIWIYTGNERLINKLKKIRMMKTMNYTRAQLDVSALTDNKDIQIQILQGNLNAALNRLEMYMEKEKQLNQKIEELERSLKERNKEILSKLEEVLVNE